MSEIIMSKEDAQSLIDNSNDTDSITFKPNPKRRNTLTYNRWEKYSKAKTCGEYLKLNSDGDQNGDLLYGIMRGHITIKNS